MLHVVRKLNRQIIKNAYTAPCVYFERTQCLKASQMCDMIARDNCNIGGGLVYGAYSRFHNYVFQTSKSIQCNILGVCDEKLHNTVLRTVARRTPTTPGAVNKLNSRRLRRRQNKLSNSLSRPINQLSQSSARSITQSWTKKILTISLSFETRISASISSLFRAT